MLASVLLLTLLLQPAGAAPAPESIDRLYEELERKADADGIAALFRARPFEVILLVDGYLEAWLSEQEKPAAERVANPERPLELAKAAAASADALFQTDAYSRYAKAWESWTDDQRVQFRQGQHEYQAGREAQQAKNYDAARAAYQQSLDLARPLGDLWGIAQAEQRLGDLAVGRGEIEEATRRHRAALDIFGALRHTGMIRSCRALATFHEQAQELSEARALLERLLVAADEAGRPEVAGPVRTDLVRICRALGDEEAAQRHAASEAAAAGKATRDGHDG